jgi:protein required for attachment to host cells
MTHHKLSHGALGFVGDGQKALFLINEGDEKFPNLRCLAAEEHPDPPSHEQGSDAPGRAYSSVGEIRSAVAETDWHQLAKEHFAASIAERINRAAQSGAFNQIIIVAPPKILGDLRREFAKETETKIVAEIERLLTAE